MPGKEPLDEPAPQRYILIEFTENGDGEYGASCTVTGIPHLTGEDGELDGKELARTLISLGESIAEDEEG